MPYWTANRETQAQSSAFCLIPLQTFYTKTVTPGVPTQPLVEKLNPQILQFFWFQTWYAKAFISICSASCVDFSYSEEPWLAWTPPKAAYKKWP